MPHAATRVLAVLELLQTRGRMSGTELAEALQVHGRTVRRYVAALEDLGIPVLAEQGRDGGYRLIAGFKLPPLLFSDDEALALSVGLLAARGFGLGEAAPAVASAQAKLERVMPEKLKRRVRAIDETVTIEMSRAPAALNNEVLVALTTAAQTQTRVHLRYRSPPREGAPEADTARDFDPYGLAWRAGRWYVVGHCHLRRGLRSFRLDRVLEVNPVPASFGRPAGFDALDHLKRSVAVLPRRHVVEVRLATDLATAQRELFSAFGVLEWDGTGVLLRAQADDLTWFARELARLPFAFRIERPAGLRKALAKLAQELAAISMQ